MRVRYILLLTSLLLLFWAWWGDIGAGLFAQIFTKEMSDDSVTRMGQWGDSFGAFNALTSAAGFAVILVTLIIQSRAIRNQADDLHRQRFEQTFFEMMRLLRELRKEVMFKHSSEYIETAKKTGGSDIKFGVDAFTEASYEISYWLRERKHRENTASEQISDIYDTYIHRKNEATFSPYFRLIYSILYRIKTDSVLNISEKIRYGNFLRANLTSWEIYLLAVN